MKTKEGSLSWSSLKCNLDPWIREGIKSLGFQTMTPVQASTIPLFAGNKDVVVEAVTGSGKTFAYTIPMLQKVSNLLYSDGDDKEAQPIKKGHMIGIVIAPTRELASQIQAVFQSLLQFLPEDKQPIKTQLLVGSLSSIREDVENFLNEGPQVIVATPGRLLEFLTSSYIKSKSVEIVVLDEADRLLDISFKNEVTKILKILPKQRRTGLFSATISSAGDAIFSTGMLNPVRVSVKSKNSKNSAPASLQINYLLVNPERKVSVLSRLLNDYQFKKCIVYLPTCTSVKYFYNIFRSLLVNKEKNLQFFSLHGQLSTKPRLKTLQTFSDTDSYLRKGILLTTDVAARGIDIPDVDLVIQLDPPTDPDVFLHRCGRTGRANKVGRAIVMLNENTREEDYIDFMDVKGIKLNRMETPDSPEHDSLLNSMRAYILEDRARNELAVKSYVAFIRYYSKHITSSIFRLQSLDYILIAKMYGLLRLPKMPELKFIPPETIPKDGWLVEPIDMDKYSYSDKEKERTRLLNMESDKNKKIMDAKKRKELKVKNEAWSYKVGTKDAKQERREKMKRKREQIENQLLEESSDEDDKTNVDWKEIVKSNKRKKATDSALIGSFDDL